LIWPRRSHLVFRQRDELYYHFDSHNAGMLFYSILPVVAITPQFWGQTTTRKECRLVVLSPTAQKVGKIARRKIYGWSVLGVRLAITI